MAKWALFTGVVGVLLLTGPILKRTSPELYQKAKVWGEEHPWRVALLGGLLLVPTVYVVRDLTDRSGGLHPLAFGCTFAIITGFVNSHRQRPEPSEPKERE